MCVIVCVLVSVRRKARPRTNIPECLTGQGHWILGILDRTDTARRDRKVKIQFYQAAVF